MAATKKVAAKSTSRISEVGRERIAAAQRKRWKKFRAEKKKEARG